MTSNPVAEVWLEPFVSGTALVATDALVLTVNQELSQNRRAMILCQPGVPPRAVVNAAVARDCGWTGSGGGDRLPADLPAVRDGLAAAGVALHDPDNVFFLPPEQELAAPPATVGAVTIRPLGESDHGAFAAFLAACTEAEIDEAYVELDHWLVMGAFVDQHLVSAASAYPWGESLAADIGILTSGEHRGNGYGSALVRAICAAIRTRGYEPQYRCSHTNQASAATALAAGFRAFARWEVAVAAEPEQ